MITKSLFFIEITDTFAGEANYSWVTRHAIKASSFRGAMIKLSKLSGINWRKTANYGDQCRYDSKSGATCAFIEHYDDSMHSDVSYSTDERQ